MAHKYTIIIGVEYDKDGNLIEDQELLCDQYEARIITFFGGFRRNWVLGSWNDGEKIVTERSAVYTIIDTGEMEREHTARGLARDGKSTFNQESVLFTVEKLTHASFV